MTDTNEENAQETVRPPQQARSRATLDRLLEAAHTLFIENRLDEATVQEIVQRAGSSVGAFYGRFPDKDAFVRCFDERFFECAQAQWDTFFSSPAWRDVSLPRALRQFVRTVVEKSRSHQEMLRAVSLYYRSRPDTPFQQRAERLNEYMLAKIRERVLATPKNTGRANLSSAIDLGVVMVSGAAREVIVFDKGHEARQFSAEQLIEELTHALLAYLGIADDQPAEPPVQEGSNS